jgi:DtxR family Mn-dependent transcriptional regulator
MVAKKRRTDHSRSVEDFLKAVFSIQTRTDSGDKPARASTNALAEALSISPPSVTDMARRMVDEGLVDYRKYYGVRLTDSGREIALRVIRRHRLIELYLVEKLGYELHEVHDEAERLEHVVSDRFIEAIEEKLEFPTVDPHGDPIPTVDGEIEQLDLTPLAELPLATRARVSRFRAESDEMLQHILSRDFKLGAVVEIAHRDPFDGPLTVRIDSAEWIIGYTVASSILVEPLDV